MSNVSLGNIERPTKKYNLKCLKGGEVIIYTKMIVNETREINSSEESNEYVRSLIALCNAIQSWNLKTDTGEDAPITVDTLGLIWQEDLIEMMAIFTDKTVEEMTELAMKIAEKKSN